MNRQQLVLKKKLRKRRKKSHGSRKKKNKLITDGMYVKIANDFILYHIYTNYL